MTAGTAGDAFEKALAFTMKWEGGFVDHPNDPGGRTNRGVTQRVYDVWRRDNGVEPRDVLEIEDGELHDIYDRGYWQKARCDQLRAALNLIQFDTAVNIGPHRAIRLLQRTLDCDDDGLFGPVTAAAAAACDVPTAMKAYCNGRERYYRGLVESNPSLSVFLKGWLNRLEDLQMEVGVMPPTRGRMVDYGDAGYNARIPDLAPDAALEDWV